jgi:MFS family permease
MIRPQYRIYACFFGFALALGAFLSRLPDLQRQFELSESQLGLLLLSFAIGSVTSLTLSTPWILKMGARKTTALTVLGTAFLYALVPWMPNAVTAFVVMVVIGFLAGMLEIVLNVETDRLEALLGRRMMNRAHGFWSFGFFVTALISAMVRQAGVPMQTHTAVAFVVVALLALVMLPGMKTTPARPETAGDAAGSHRIALPTLGLIPLCLIAIAALLIEGAGIDWSAIYMRDIFHVEPFIGGLGLTLFSGFMAATRLSADPIVDRFGPRAVVVGLLGIGAVGAALVALAPVPEMALVGFALMGAGCSGVYPLAMSAAAQRTDRPSAMNVAALGQMAFVTFFLAPPLLGFAAQYLGIRWSYAIVLPVIIGALLLNRAVAPRPLKAAAANA